MPAGPSSDLPLVTRRADPLADNELVIVACPRPDPPLGQSLYITKLCKPGTGFSVNDLEPAAPAAPSRGRPLGPSGQPPPPTVAHVFGAARGPPSDGVPCSSAEAASDPERAAGHDRATGRDVLDHPRSPPTAAIGPPPATMRPSSRASGQLRYAALTSGPPSVREPSHGRPAGGLVGQAAARPAAGLPLLAAKPATRASSPPSARTMARRAPVTAFPTLPKGHACAGAPERPSAGAAVESRARRAAGHKSRCSGPGSLRDRAAELALMPGRPRCSERPPQRPPRGAAFSI